jgi:hypothetical protein
MKKQKQVSKKKNTNNQETVLTKEQFLANLKRVILTVKKPKSPAKEKKVPSE